MTTTNRISVRSPEQWAVLVAPVRMEIAEGLRCLGACSVAELAALIDRPADTLYRHIELLREAGFIVSAGTRKRGRHVEQLIELAGDDVVIQFDPVADHDGNDAVLATARGFMRAAERAIRDSAKCKQLVVGGADGNVTVNYELGWLTADAYDEVRSLVHRIKAIMDDGKRRREGRLFLSLAIVTPVTRKPRKSQSRTGRGTRDRDPATESDSISDPNPNRNPNPNPTHETQSDIIRRS